MTIVAIYGLYEVHIMPKPYLRYRYRSVYRDSPQLSGFQISVALPFLYLYAIRLWRFAPRRLFSFASRTLAVATVICLLYFLQFTLSRTAVLATSVGSFVFFILIWRKKRRASLISFLFKLTFALLILFGGSLLS